MTTNQDLFDRGQLVMPGGVNSPVRAFRSVGGTPYFVARGEGAHVWDVQGARYVDMVQSYGASILGHADPEVVEAIRDAAGRGSTYGAPTQGEVELAEALVARYDGLEMVRLVSSGTEAAMSAIRLARGVTGRSKIVKFSGNYHGHSDALLVAGGSALAEESVPDSAGVTSGAVSDTVVVPYNVVPELDESVAVVAIEPVAANMGLVPPAPGFLEGLRAACDEVGALLLFDEVITGCRLAPGGATELYGVRPDVWCFGKVIGGGLPVGAYGASREVMEHIAPCGPVYQAGTLSGNPLATAAGATVLGRLDADAHARLNSTAERLADGLRSVMSEAGVPCTVPRVGPLVGCFFGDTDPVDFDSARLIADNGLYPRFFRGMLERGVALAPGAYEVMFPSLAHDETVLGHVLEAAAEVAPSLRPN